MNTLAEQQALFRESARRFADHYLAHVQDHILDYPTLDEELDNLFRALATYSRLQAWLDVAHLVQALGIFLDTRGYWAEHRFWLEQALNHSEVLDGHPTLRIEILESLAHIISSQGDRDTAQDLYQAVIRLAEQDQDELHLARAYYGLGTVYFGAGQMDKAQSCWERALSLADHIGDEVQAPVIRYFLGSLNLSGADTDRAPKEMDSAVRLAAKIAPRLGLVGKTLLVQLRAMTYFAQGRHDQARHHYLEALELAREEGERQGEALALYQLGQIAHHQGDLPAALDYYRQSEAIAKELDDRTGLMALYSAIGLVYLQQQRFDLARPYLEQSVTLEREAGNQEQVAENLYWLGYAVANTGDPRQAEQVFEESLAVFTRLDSPRAQDVRQAVRRLRAVMGQDDG